MFIRVRMGVRRSRQIMATAMELMNMKLDSVPIKRDRRSFIPAPRYWAMMISLAPESPRHTKVSRERTSPPMDRPDRPVSPTT